MTSDNQTTNPSSLDPINSNQDQYDALVKQYQDMLNNYSDEVNQLSNQPLPQDILQTPLSDLSPPNQSLLEDSPVFQTTVPPTPLNNDASSTMDSTKITDLPPLGLNPPPLPRPFDSKETLLPVPPLPLQSFTSSPIVGTTTFNEKPVSAITPPNDSVVPMTVQSDSTKSDIFKYLFFISLIIFLAVISANIYVLFNSQKANKPASTIPSINTPTIIDTKSCKLNDKNYQIGESFSAADSCNQCTCQDDLTVKCTENSCTPTPSGN